MTDILADPVAQAALSGGFGMLVGFVVGYFVKKVAKFLMFFAGGAFLLMLYAQSGGYVSINWAQVQNATQANLQSMMTSDFGASALMATLGIPLFGGLALGFGAGIAKG